MFSSFSIKHAGAVTKAEARHQLQVILFISFLPLLIGFLAISYPNDGKVLAALQDGFSTVFLHGELYFYAMSTCAHIFYLSSYTEKRGIREVRLYSGVFVIFCTALMALYIGQGEENNRIMHGVLSIAL